MGLAGIGPALAASVLSGNAQNQGQSYQGQAYNQFNNALGGGGAGLSAQASLQGLGQAGSPSASPYPYPPPAPVTKHQPVTIESHDDQHTVMLDGMPVFRSADEAEARRTAETLETMSEVMVRKAPPAAPPGAMLIGVDVGDSSETAIATTSYVYSSHSYSKPMVHGSLPTGDALKDIQDAMNTASEKMMMAVFGGGGPDPGERSSTHIKTLVEEGEKRLAKIMRRMFGS